MRVPFVPILVRGGRADPRPRSAFRSAPDSGHPDALRGRGKGHLRQVGDPGAGSVASALWGEVLKANGAMSRGSNRNPRDTMG